MRDIYQINGNGYYRYIRDTSGNKCNVRTGVGIIGLDLNGSTLSCIFFGIDGELEKLRYTISNDSSVYIMGFYL